MGVLFDPETPLDASPAQICALLLAHKFTVGDEHSLALGREHLQELGDKQDPHSPTGVALVGQHRPYQRQDHATQQDAENQDVEGRLSVMPGGAVHHHGQSAAE